MGAHADTAALSLPVNTRVADCIAIAITLVSTGPRQTRDRSASASRAASRSVRHRQCYQEVQRHRAVTRYEAPFESLRRGPGFRSHYGNSTVLRLHTVIDSCSASSQEGIVLGFPTIIGEPFLRNYAEMATRQNPGSPARVP